MTIAKLKELIKDLPDDMKVLVPGEPKEGFTGLFFSPCQEDSGEIEMGGDETMTEEDFERHETLGTLEMERSFVLVPCGFYEEHDSSHELN